MIIFNLLMFCQARETRAFSRASDPTLAAVLYERNMKTLEAIK